MRNLPYELIEQIVTLADNIDIDMIWEIFEKKTSFRLTRYMFSEKYANIPKPYTDTIDTSVTCVTLCFYILISWPIYEFRVYSNGSKMFSGRRGGYMRYS